MQTLYAFGAPINEPVQTPYDFGACINMAKQALPLKFISTCNVSNAKPSATNTVLARHDVTVNHPYNNSKVALLYCIKLHSVALFCVGVCSRLPVALDGFIKDLS